MTDHTHALEACPLCGSDDVEMDCYARAEGGVCTEPAVNCNNCGLMAVFDFAAKVPWEELARRWNTRALLKQPEGSVERD